MAFGAHLAETREHVERLERVFELAGAETSSSPDRAFERLAEQHETIAGAIVDRRLADVFHAASAARTEHVELAAYASLIALAEALELPEAAKLLGRTRDEEAKALERAEQLGARLAREVAAEAG